MNSYVFLFIIKIECTCDPDYSLSNECDPVTGQCPCKPNMKGKDCTEPDDGWFCPTPGETKGNFFFQRNSGKYIM